MSQAGNWCENHKNEVKGPKFGRIVDMQNSAQWGEALKQPKSSPYWGQGCIWASLVVVLKKPMHQNLYTGLN